MSTLIIVVVLFIFAWLFLVLPSRRRQRSHQAMQDSVSLNDEIITAGGLHGFVREVTDDEVRLEIADGVVVRIDRRAIAAVAEDLPADDEDDGEPGDLAGGEDPEDGGEDQTEESLKG
jgi:preprotein translocase subunit YajC